MAADTCSQASEARMIVRATQRRLRFPVGSPIKFFDVMHGAAILPLQSTIFWIRCFLTHFVRLNFLPLVDMA